MPGVSLGIVLPVAKDPFAARRPEEESRSGFHTRAHRPREVDRGVGGAQAGASDRQMPNPLTPEDFCVVFWLTPESTT